MSEQSNKEQTHNNDEKWNKCMKLNGHTTSTKGYERTTKKNYIPEQKMWPLEEQCQSQELRHYTNLATYILTFLFTIYLVCPFFHNFFFLFWKVHKCSFNIYFLLAIGIAPYADTLNAQWTDNHALNHRFRWRASDTKRSEKHTSIAKEEEEQGAARSTIACVLSLLEQYSYRYFDYYGSQFMAKNCC